MTGEIMLIPSFEGQINSLILPVSQFITLSVLMVGIVNTMKNPLSFLGAWFFLAPLSMGVGLLMIIVLLFGDVFTLSYGQAAFFGAFVGLGSIGLYEAGLGNKKKETIQDFDLSQ